MMLITLVIGASTASECSLAPDGRRWVIDIILDEPGNTHVAHLIAEVRGDSEEKIKIFC